VKLGKGLDIANNDRIQKTVADIERKLGKSGRVLLRPSGTEPVVRVMVEGEDKDVVLDFARELSAVVAAEVEKSQ